MELTFEEFQKEYMTNFAGYVPTYLTADEEYSKQGFISINIEMIAPFRMSDGPSRFFRVINLKITEEQYEQIKKYVAEAGKAWKNQLQKTAAGIYNYSNKFK